MGLIRCSVMEHWFWHQLPSMVVSYCPTHVGKSQANTHDSIPPRSSRYVSLSFSLRQPILTAHRNSPYMSTSSIELNASIWLGLMAHLSIPCSSPTSHQRCSLPRHWTPRQQGTSESENYRQSQDCSWLLENSWSTQTDGGGWGFWWHLLEE